MSSRLAGPFGAFGCVAGLAAASLFLPDGCKIDAAASLRLRAGLPLVTPLLMMLLGLAAGRVRARVAIPLVLVAGALHACATALLYDGYKGLDAAPMAALSVWPFHAVALVALPLAVRFARRSLEAPRGSPSARADRAVVWSVIAAGGCVAAGGLIAAGRVPIDVRLACAAGAGAALLACVAGVVVARVGDSLSQLAALAAVPAETGAPLPESLRRARQDRVVATLALLIAIGGCAVTAFAIAEAPPWVPPKQEHVSFSLGPHC